MKNKLVLIVAIAFASTVFCSSLSTHPAAARPVTVTSHPMSPAVSPDSEACRVFVQSLGICLIGVGGGGGIHGAMRD